MSWLWMECSYIVIRTVAVSQDEFFSALVFSYFCLQHFLIVYSMEKRISAVS